MWYIQSNDCLVYVSGSYSVCNILQQKFVVWRVDESKGIRFFEYFTSLQGRCKIKTISGITRDHTDVRDPSQNHKSEDLT
jgi:hypothetical protein